MNKRNVGLFIAIMIAFAAIIDGIQYAIDLLGEDHVCFGSDFDGSITPSFDISQLPVLTHIMLERGLHESTVKKIMGGNGLRFFGTVLPATLPL